MQKNKFILRTNMTCLWSFYLDFHSPCKAASLLPVSISVTVNSIDLFQNGGHDY